MNKTKIEDKMVSAYHSYSPKELYELASEEKKVAFRDAYLSHTGMKYTTFYYKLRTGHFQFLEEKAFFEVLENYPLL